MLLEAHGVVSKSVLRMIILFKEKCAKSSKHKKVPKKTEKCTKNVKMRKSEKFDFIQKSKNAQKKSEKNVLCSFPLFTAKHKIR